MRVISVRVSDEMYEKIIAAKFERESLSDFLRHSVRTTLILRGERK